MFLDLSTPAPGSATCNFPATSLYADSYLSTGAGGISTMGIGSTKTTGLAINFTAGGLTPGQQWFLRFNPANYPGTSFANVTRIDATTWSIEAPAGAVAELLSAPTTGKFVLTPCGTYVMPTQLTVSTK